MVRSSSLTKLFLVLVTVMLNAVSMAPSLPIFATNGDVNAGEEDSAVRIERSTNVSRLTGTGSKIRMYIREKYLQIFVDGTVNATDDDSSIYSILQRTSVNPGQVKIQGVATCMFLCMDSCGLLYSTREFQDECVFDEKLEKDYYNVYFSTKHSDRRRTFYLAISKNSTPRKVEIKGNHTLGKWSSCTEVLPQPVDHQSILDLENRLLAMQPKSNRHSLRHHQLCPPAHHTKITISNKCRKQLKRKKKKKTADEENDDESKASLLKKNEENDQGSISNKKGNKRRKTEKKKSILHHQASKVDEESLTGLSAEIDPEEDETP